MYERFTDRARKVMQLANQEAQRLNHEYIGTEHILLGLVKEGSGAAASVLKSLGIDLPKLRQEVNKIIQTAPGVLTPGKLPQTPRAKKAIESAIEEARNLNDYGVGTEHLLLGLLRDIDEGGAQLFRNLGCDPKGLRPLVLAYRDSAHLLQPSSSLDSWIHGRQVRRGVIREYDLFVPLHYDDGTAVEADKLARLREQFVKQFGGLIDLHQRHEGHWRIGGVAFRDEIVIYRALADDVDAARKFFRQVKEELKADLSQEDILIVERQVEVL
jgi:ATP-dependent Clp protease ATP-binding subunit ClpA